MLLDIVKELVVPRLSLLVVMPVGCRPLVVGLGDVRQGNLLHHKSTVLLHILGDEVDLVPADRPQGFKCNPPTWGEVSIS